MVKQKTLFSEEEIGKKKSIRTARRQLKKLRFKKDDIKLVSQSKKPKNEIYKCECGLKMHYLVAEGRSDGCPQCNRKIPLSKIYEGKE